MSIVKRKIVDIKEDSVASPAHPSMATRQSQYFIWSKGLFICKRIPEFKNTMPTLTGIFPLRGRFCLHLKLSGFWKTEGWWHSPDRSQRSQLGPLQKQLPLPKPGRYPRLHCRFSCPTPDPGTLLCNSSQVKIVGAHSRVCWASLQRRHRKCYHSFFVWKGTKNYQKWAVSLSFSLR